MPERVEIKRLEPYLWEIPRSGEMLVPGRVYASAGRMEEIRGDESIQQVKNVAQLPGIVGWSLAMPDIHWGYGFPIGGVAATDAGHGAISPGGVGYDINCGVRLARTDLAAEAVQGRLPRLLDELFAAVPSGVGAEGAISKLSRPEPRRILERGATWAVERGYGEADDLEHTEERGCLDGADPSELSDRAEERGLAQVGTLGSGNHFLEVQRVAEIHDAEVAEAFGLFVD